MTASVLFIHELGDSASSHYRAHIPALGLTKLGWPVTLSSVLVELPDGKVTGIHNNQLLRPPKIIVTRRMNAPAVYSEGDVNLIGDSGLYEPVYPMFDKARRKGQKIYVDLDDDPWNLPEHISEHTMSADELALWTEDMNHSDGVLVSTPTIARSAREHLKVPVHVCRNGIDTIDYKPNMEERTPLRLGWIGNTVYRGPDLLSIVQDLRTALEGYWDKVELWHLGAFGTIALKGNPPIESPSIRDLLGPSFPVQIVERPWVGIADLPRALAQIDVAVLPVLSPSRSATSGLALMAAGVPFAATTTNEEYGNLWKMGAGYPLEGPESIRVLVDPSYVQARADIRANGLFVVRKYFSPSHVAENWRDVFNINHGA